MIQLGSIVGDRFKVEAKVASGGMAAVYRAIDLQRGGRVALKFDAAMVDDSPQRFDRESSLLAELDHPNIVRYVAHGFIGPEARFLAMEWLTGEDLQDYLARSKALSVDESLLLCRQVAQALAVAHARGVTHRDIKPSNIFLVDGQLSNVKIIDFGVAKVAEAGLALTRVGAMLGTPGYMSPEQIAGALTLDARADIFALGCILHECLTGRRAFDGDSDVAVISKVLLEDPVPATHHNPEIPANLQHLLTLMLEKSREARPADGGVLLDELDNLDAFSSLSATKPVGLRDVLALQEQRCVSLVLSGSAARTAEDLEALKREVERTTKRLEPQIEWLPNGAIIVIFTGGSANPQRLANNAARCALHLRKLMPEAPFALVSDQRNKQDFQLPLGRVIDRAAATLVQTPPGVIAADGQSTMHLREQFSFEETDALIMLMGSR